MSRRLLAALATALTILALPALAQAELTTLNTDLTTGADSDRFVNPGDAVAVTATGDPTLTLEYRFVVQYDNAGTWEQVAASAWGSTNTYSFDPATDTGGPFAAGNYRLVTLVREAGNPGDFLANYQRHAGRRDAEPRGPQHRRCADGAGFARHSVQPRQQRPRPVHPVVQR
ncbi:MAG: hypothetical protein ACLGHJ_09920 [Gammaproteobacteria bacterium]